MRLVFISSVTAMTPLRTISAITGSSGPRFARPTPICFVPFRAIVLLPAGVGWVKVVGWARRPGHRGVGIIRPSGFADAVHRHHCRTRPKPDGVGEGARGSRITPSAVPGAFAHPTVP